MSACSCAFCGCPSVGVFSESARRRCARSATCRGERAEGGGPCTRRLDLLSLLVCLVFCLAGGEPHGGLFVETSTLGGDRSRNRLDAGSPCGPALEEEQLDPRLALRSRGALFSCCDCIGSLVETCSRRWTGNLDPLPEQVRATLRSRRSSWIRGSLSLWDAHARQAQLDFIAVVPCRIMRVRRVGGKEGRNEADDASLLERAHHDLLREEPCDAYDNVSMARSSKSDERRTHR